MSIRIDKEKCRHCGQCVEVCPGNLIHTDDQGRAYLRHPEECWGCTSCLKQCAFGAIAFYLGADIGGRGSTMYTKRQGDLCHWIIQSPGQEPLTITVDRTQSNQY
jgi:adenylylsulfate reductase subunit B